MSQFNRPAHLRALLLAAFIAATAGTADAASLTGAVLVDALRHGGYVLVMRHADSPFAAPDKSAANPDNSKLERQLDETGRSTARAMGEAGRRFALGFFSTERYAMGYRRLFELAESLLDPESPVDSRAARMASR